MSGFRLGDQHVEIAGVRTRLRLSVSALAEIASGFGTRSPTELVARLRSANAVDWHVILRAMATPRPKDNLSNTELLDLVPTLSAVMTAGLMP